MTSAQGAKSALDPPALENPAPALLAGFSDWVASDDAADEATDEATDVTATVVEFEAEVFVEDPLALSPANTTTPATRS